ncbi:Uncharacterised protein [Halioglobus japonicus]|nr:Uncharacterised protein [Halioglobus japonicus]
MIDTAQAVLAPYYLQIKFVHILCSMMWLWSTSVAFLYFVVPVMQHWRRSPQDADLIALRNWVLERFDQGVVLEHVAFPLVIISGVLMLCAGGWTTASNWLVLKLAIVCAIVLPIEILDYHLSHFSGNKRFKRDKGDEVGYEKAIDFHWKFLLLSTPPMIVFGISILYLAVVKPF